MHTLGFGLGRTGAGLAMFAGSGGNSRAGTRFESHLGHRVSQVRRIRKRIKTDGSSSMVLRRDPKSREARQPPRFVEAETLKRLLYANGQSFDIAQHAILSNEKRTPSVADTIQVHIGLLIRPSSGTIKTYQTMLDLHIGNVIGHLPVDKLDYRLMAHWVKSNHEYRGDAGVHSVEPSPRRAAASYPKAEDEANFLTHAEFSLIMEGMGERYKAFTNFLVMTGTASEKQRLRPWLMFTCSPSHPPLGSTRHGSGTGRTSSMLARRRQVRVSPL